MTEIKLIDELDKAASALLEKSRTGDSVPSEDSASVSHETGSSLAEQVKAFQAVVEYAKIRPQLVPQKKKEAAFDGLKRQFNGETVNRRGKRGKAEDEADGSNADDGDHAVPSAAIALDS